ncbi:MAG: hypothetical protein GWO24_21915, partial [Akkermansiaceae bacterium]|nr:hypothetical protein [Akkermansiaceae bacterium]
MNCGPVSATSALSFADHTARLFSPKIRAAERRLAEIEEVVASLPELYSGPRGSRFGFHSETIPNQFEPHSLDIDLGRSWPIDSIVAIPVHLPTRGVSGEGYGFPLRFKIEVFKTTDRGNPEL